MGFHPTTIPKSNSAKLPNANPGHSGSYVSAISPSLTSTAVITDHKIPPRLPSQEVHPNLSEKMSKPEGYPFIGEPTGLKVIIVGAGLGGLACAIECRRKGHQVILFENAPEIMRIGDTLVNTSSLPFHISHFILSFPNFDPRSLPRESVRMRGD